MISPWTTLSDHPDHQQEQTSQMLEPPKNEELLPKRRKISLVFAGLGVFLMALGGMPFLFPGGDQEQYSADLLGTSLETSPEFSPDPEPIDEVFDMGAAIPESAPLPSSIPVATPPPPIALPPLESLPRLPVSPVVPITRDESDLSAESPLRENRHVVTPGQEKIVTHVAAYQEISPPEAAGALHGAAPASDSQQAVSHAKTGPSALPLFAASGLLSLVFFLRRKTGKRAL